MAAATSSAVTSRPMGWRALSAARSAAGSGAASSSRRHPRGVGRAGGHAVDPDALGHVVGRHGQRERVDGALARAVQRPLRQARDGGDRAGVDDGGLAAARDRPAQRGRAARVVRTMPSTFTSRTRCHSSSSLSSTVPAAPMPALLTRMSSRPARPRRPRDRLPDRAVVGHVGDDRGRPAVRRPGPQAICPVQDRDPGAALGQQPRGGQADARGAAGDERRQAGELRLIAPPYIRCIAHAAVVVQSLRTRTLSRAPSGGTRALPTARTPPAKPGWTGSRAS